jgi:hypothetical protein
MLIAVKELNYTGMPVWGILVGTGELAALLLMQKGASLAASWHCILTFWVLLKWIIAIRYICFVSVLLLSSSLIAILYDYTVIFSGTFIYIFNINNYLQE